jgi:Ser/Thr protein kinase RdoA (MazF antagonist)
MEGEPRPVADSVLGENYRVDTDRGTRFVRFAQKKRTQEVVLAEFRAMRFAAEGGIPVALPLTGESSSPVASIGGRVVSVFPWVEGRTAKRGAMSEREAAVLGDMHGRLQAVLAQYRDPVLAARDPGEISWDAEASIAALSRVDDLIRYYPAPPAEHLAAQAALRYQLELLESDEPRPAADFAGLPMQVEHGDYHERNVLLDGGGEVAAVVDWERIRVLPRAFQLVRALDFTGLLDGGPLDAYLQAYGRHIRLARASAQARWSSGGRACSTTRGCSPTCSCAGMCGRRDSSRSICRGCGGCGTWTPGGGWRPRSSGTPRGSAAYTCAMTSVSTRPMTIDEFLALPEQDEPKLEFLRGEVVEKASRVPAQPRGLLGGDPGRGVTRPGGSLRLKA